MGDHPAILPRQREACSVVGPGCTAPPQAEPRRTPRSECFGCGLKVCTKCSRRIPWYNYGRKRICTNCITDHLGEDAYV